MKTIEEQKAELMEQIEAAGEDWDLVESLARRALKLEPGWFDAATRWQAACMERSAVAARNSFCAAQTARSNPSRQNLQRAEEAALEALNLATRALRANQLVRALVDGQRQ